MNPIRWAAILFFLTGLAQVVFVPQTMAHIARYREHPLVFPGVRGLAGPFDALGLDAVIVLGGLFVVLGQIEVHGFCLPPAVGPPPASGCDPAAGLEAVRVGPS